MMYINGQVDSDASISDVILTQVSKCMMSGAIGDPGETIEVPFQPVYVNHEHEKCLQEA